VLPDGAGGRTGSGSEALGDGGGGVSMTGVRLVYMFTFSSACESSRVGDEGGECSCEPRSTLLVDEACFGTWDMFMRGCLQTSADAVWLVADADASGGRRWLSTLGGLSLGPKGPIALHESRGPAVGGIGILASGVRLAALEMDRQTDRFEVGGDDGEGGVGRR